MSPESALARPLYYLFGVIPHGQALPEVDSVATQAVTEGPLTAIVERVAASEFAPDVLEERLKSLEVVTPLARRHQAVLADAMSRGPVVPARLCTLFSAEQAVKECLAEGRRSFLDKLARVAGCREWGLSVRCDEKTLGAAVAADTPAPAPRPDLSPAQAYLLSKKRKAEMAELLEQRMQELADEIADEVEPLVDELRDRPARDDGSGMTVLLDLAMLVMDDSEGALHAAVEDLAARLGPLGLSFVVSGPWPAYSFLQDNETCTARGADHEPSA